MLLAAKCYSYLSTDINTPVLSAWCQAFGKVALGEIGSASRMQRFERFLDKRMFDPEFRWKSQYFRASNITKYGFKTVKDIPPAVRCAFARRTGIGVAEQIALEDMYRKMCEDVIPSDYPRIVVDWFLRPNCSIEGDLFADT